LLLRCLIDDLLLPAEVQPDADRILVYDDDESFLLEYVEAMYYELVAATEDERLTIQRNYRLLRTAADFRRVAA
jgi:hypothetical protein